MRLQELHRRSLAFYKLMFKEKLDNKNDQTKNEHKNADAVNAMHIFDKPCFWTIGIRFFDVEIFCYLLKYTHKKS